MSSTGRTLILSLVDAIENNKVHLSEIDGAIGDGDHGVNMAKGFALIRERLGDAEPDLADALDLIGRTLLTDIGGSMGPIYGTFFIEMSQAARGRDSADVHTLLSMLSAARAGVAELGSARVGDKTLIDTLVPAEVALREALDSGLSPGDAIAKMVDAAHRGCESTRDLIARLGRASRLGERSRGTVDAGAASCAVIIQTLGFHFNAARQHSPPC